MVPFTLPLAQCACPAGNLLPLIVIGFAGWGLWQAAQWIGKRLASRRAVLNSGMAHPPRTGIIFAALVTCMLLAVGAGNALRSTPAVELSATAQPRMIFLGAGKCKPCQAMEPVREGLRTAYADAITVEYHDVWKDPEPGHRFGIKSIPTTLFVAPDGRELLRRQGYLSEDDIINQWRELGFALTKGSEHEEQK